MKNYYRLAFAFVPIAAHIFASNVAAHPLGNFTINHYAGLHITPKTIIIDYILDMAEIPAFQEIATLDVNQDGKADSLETADYPPTQCNDIGSQLDLRVNGRSLPLTRLSTALELPPGQGGLATLRLSCTYRVDISAPAESWQVEFENNAYAARLGWREIVVTAGGVALQGDFASTSTSNRLTTYPDDLLTSPLDQRRVSFLILPGIPVETQQGISPMKNQSSGPFISGQPDNISRFATRRSFALIWLIPLFIACFLTAVMLVRHRQEKVSCTASVFVIGLLAFSAPGRF